MQCTFFMCLAFLLTWGFCNPSDCLFRINEINADTPQQQETLEFIEIKAFNCPKTVDITGLRLLFVKGMGRSQWPEVEGYVSIPKGQVKLTKNLYLIGDSGVTPSPDLTFDHSGVYLRQKFYQKRGSLLSHFNIANGNQVPYGVLLLKIPPNQVITFHNKFQLFISKQYVKLDATVSDYIKPFILDCVVYSRRAPYDRCSVFETLVPELADKRYVLTEWDSSVGGVDLSLNRCTEITLPFQYAYFKLGKPTPKDDNDCTGPRFLLSEHLQESFPQSPQREATVSSDVEEVQLSQTREGLEAECSLGSPSVHSSDIYAHTSASLSSEISFSQEEACTYDMPEEVSEVASSSASAVSRKRSIVAEIVATDLPPEKAAKAKRDAAPPDWDSDKFFDDAWLTFADQHIPNHMFRSQWVRDNPSWKKWLKIVPNIENPAETVFQCRICHQYYDQFMDNEYKPALANGISLINDPAKRVKNYEKLSEHTSKRGKKGQAGKGTAAHRTGGTKHQQLIDALAVSSQKQIQSSVQQMIANIETNVQEGKFKVTANMIRTVYTECKLNVPFSQHHNMVQLLKSTGSPMGNHHSDQTSAKRMLLSISQLMHMRLLKHFAKRNVGPLALVADASTTYHGDHYFITYFRALELDILEEGSSFSERPVLYFYKLILMDEVSESADDYMKKIQESLEYDKTHFKVDMPAIIKRNLVGFGSDGASVMSGRQGGLIKKLEDYVGKPLVHIHCMAHRLQLAVSHAWSDEVHFKDMELLVDGVHNFYFNRGHKTKAHLQKTAESFSESFYVLRQIFKVRWIASEKRAVENLIKSWYVLVVDLQEISDDPEGQFRPTTRYAAKGLFGQLTERHAVVMLHFLYDILSSLALLSEKMQANVGVLPVITPIINSFTQNLIKRKTDGGVSETTFLAQAICGDTPCHSIQNYYASDSVTWHGIALPKKERTRYPALSEKRDELIDKLLVQFENYFPREVLSPFTAFMPISLPINIFEVDMYRVQDIRAVASQLSLDPSGTLAQLSVALRKIIEHSDFNRFRQSSSLEFWSHFLAVSEIPWESNARKLIQSVLILPVGSADAERGFSMLKHAQYDRRSSLKHEALDAILRLRINGPDVDNFNALPYAKYWKKTGHYLTDSADKTRNPMAGMTTQERMVVDGIANIEELEESNKVFLKKSNLF